jgi:alpha-amylase/alpha-mannosidase (GH57 family)
VGIRAFSIHAHFYQPPREDPLTGSIPVEQSASPYPNWNERVHAECYRPNAELGNYEHISFNIGPTLFNWMSGHDPYTCAKILAQDQANLGRYQVGNALAQSYNHTILPLGTFQDKVTQIFWGIADFNYRFNRLPQGMWLPETAVDNETLEVLSRLGIQFTILAPWQAAQPGIDPSQPYRVNLPDDRQISIFFYQCELSSRVSFDTAATINADNFAQSILYPSFETGRAESNEPQLLMIASDGELYGHHQPFRQHFLAHLVNGASSHLGLQPTYPALWLQEHPPRQSVEIQERTSWSCHHGVARWVGTCPCTPGNGDWKFWLRYSFDRLANELDRLYLDVTAPLFKDPWQLRNQYIHVMLGQLSIDALLSETATRCLTSDETRRVRLLLEAQRERQRMYTSCGSFFEDFDRIEPRNNVAYAAQAVRLARQATGVDLEPQTTRDLQRVLSQRSYLSADTVFQSYLNAN